MWNWEQPEWPKFRWDQTRLDKAGQTFVIESGVFAGSVKHVDESGLSTITVEALSTEAATTSEIEGEMLDRASVQSSVRRELGLNPDARRSGPKEQGIAKMMVNVHRTFAEPLSEDTLCSWHAMVMKGRDLRDAGRYRTGDEAMEIVSGPYGARKAHFEAPPAGRVSREMARFVKWFNRTAPSGGRSYRR